jgi:DNA ligase-1
MVKSCDSVIQSLEADNSRLAKESILQDQVLVGNDELFEGIRMALDCMVTFGVKKVPAHGGPDGQGLPWAAFKELANLLATRQLTGHAARDAIELALSASTQSQWNDWYRRILIKDLRCGVSEKTVNKVTKGYPEYQVPIFSCQLAHEYTANERKVSGKRLIEIKLDGVRVITIVYPNGQVDQFSRNGKTLENFEHIKSEFAKIANTLKEPYVFDGEVVSSSFQALMKQVHRKTNVQSDDAVLMLFDALPLSDFKSGRSSATQCQRSAFLKSMAAVFESIDSIDLVPQNEIDFDSYTGELEFAQLNKDALANGYEGLMVKDPNAKYECKRSYSWLKLKPFIEVSLTAVAVEEGTGKHAGKMGAVLFEGEDDGRQITVSVGGGWSDEDRAEIWNGKAAVIGQIGEVRADAVTQNQDGSYSLRFPRFKCWRGFRKGEKL